jgi:hypothetical protein
MICSRLYIGRVLVLLFAFVPLALPSTIINSQFTFQGICTDCSGSATATLILQNYVQGNDIVLDNLVSFHYDGTDLLEAFTITPASQDVNIAGVIPLTLPAFAYFDITFTSPTLGWLSFSSDEAGGWIASGPRDYGTNGVWNGASVPGDVPEPGGLLMVAAGLMLIWMRRRKIRRA